MERPFSLSVPCGLFPRRTQLLDATTGTLVREIAALPLHEQVHTSFNSVRPGRRSIGWRADHPAQLYWAETQVLHEHGLATSKRVMHDRERECDGGRARGHAKMHGRTTCGRVVRGRLSWLLTDAMYAAHRMVATPPWRWTGRAISCTRCRRPSTRRRLSPESCCARSCAMGASPGATRSWPSCTSRGGVRAPCGHGASPLVGVGSWGLESCMWRCVQHERMYAATNTRPSSLLRR
eukprot:scaffold587_cov339-Prasinococcus_capsulatus_cf.AAC.6